MNKLASIVICGAFVYLVMTMLLAPVPDKMDCRPAHVAIPRVIVFGVAIQYACVPGYLPVGRPR